MSKYLVSYGGKDIDMVEADGEDEAISIVKDSDDFSAEVEEE